MGVVTPGSRAGGPSLAWLPGHYSPTRGCHRPASCLAWAHSRPRRARGKPRVTSRHARSEAARESKGTGGSAEADKMPAAAVEKSLIKANTLRLHYYRRDGRYSGWGLHVWGDTPLIVRWELPMMPLGTDGFGVYWDIHLAPEADTVKVIVHRGEDADKGEQVVHIKEVSDGRRVIAEAWLVAGEDGIHHCLPDLNHVPFGDLTRSAAHWLEPRTLAWRISPNDPETGTPYTFLLHTAQQAGISAKDQAIHGADEVVSLTPLSDNMPDRLVARAPHLLGCTCFQLPELSKADMARMLKGQLVLSCHTPEGVGVEATCVQIPHVLDDLFLYEGSLGCEVRQDAVSIALWAPTAQRVELLLWDEPVGGEWEVLPMHSDKETGAWRISGSRAWEWKYYKFRVTVYCLWTQQVEVSEATDPYARSLSADGSRTQIVDMKDGSLAPADWKTEKSPELGPGGFSEMAIYELHIRDFSASDPSVPEALRGKYQAFCESSSAGCRHLKRLSEGGITHLHLLPTYDFGSVPEREEDRAAMPPDHELRRLPPDSQEQQELLAAVADMDAFNWGYDPVHWGVPDGSYASDPDGSCRVKEFREMVQGIHGMGLRVVLDVVYNHTFRAGPHDPLSVLDKIVPGYYHRTGEAGNLLHSTCCNNTATEHLMTERLVVDDCVHWAKTYKVDGFRFDIMGHMLVRTMQRLQKALRRLTLCEDGVDGSAIYLYGEAWDFGEMCCNQRGRNASQLNIGGLGIGSFNDRFRDSVMGGSPFMDPRHQGVATGLAVDPRTDVNQGSCLDQLERLLEYSDWLRLSLAGGLRDFKLTDRHGRQSRGHEILYGAVPAGYTREPWECINYAACHDNETLFDQIVMKANAVAGLSGRLQMYRLALAFVALGQAVPFFHAGDDILRSKSLDRDSYNSGDWFNRLDWSMTTNNFGVGLPPASKNVATWHILKPMLSDPRLVPSKQQIQDTHAVFLDLLAIRRSTPLLHMPSSIAVRNQLRFLNVGPSQVPGVICMELVSADQLEVAACSLEEMDGDMELVDCPRYIRVYIVFNARPHGQTMPWPQDAADLQLHPLQPKCATSIAVVHTEARTVEVPERTSTVFVEHRQQNT